MKMKATKTPRHAANAKGPTFTVVSNMANTLIERNLRSSLHALGVLVESAVGLVALFLDGSTVLHQFLWHVLVRSLENVDKGASKVFLGFAEESDGKTVLAGTTGTRK